jgi:hypothetical protein
MPGSYRVVFDPGKAVPLSDRYRIRVLSYSPHAFRISTSLPTP